MNGHQAHDVEAFRGFDVRALCGPKCLCAHAVPPHALQLVNGACCMAYPRARDNVALLCTSLGVTSLPEFAYGLPTGLLCSQWMVAVCFALVATVNTANVTMAPTWDCWVVARDAFPTNASCANPALRATAPSLGQPTPGVVKQDKSSGGSVKTRSDPQRVGMCSGERPIGAAKGKQTKTMALCRPPPPKGPTPIRSGGST